MPFKPQAQKPKPQGEATPGAKGPANPAAGKGYAEGAAAVRPQGDGDAGDGGPATWTVERGQTLWEIAVKTLGDGNLWIRIWVANKDKVANPHALQPGTVLQIPGKGGGGDSQAPAPKHAAKAATYTVVGGDTLGAIAHKTLGDAGRWREIWELNKAQVPNPNLIRVGQVLTLPGGQAPAPAPEPQQPAPPQAPAEPAKPTQPDTYTVRSGDTLSGIAARVLGNAGRWQEIWQANRATLPNPNQLQVGQVLVLPGGAHAPQPAPEPVPMPDDGPHGPVSDEQMAMTGPQAVGHSPLEKLLANLYNSKGKLIAAEAGRLGIEAGVAAACMAVESGGTGFRNGKMVIRFEAHIFEQYGGQYVAVSHTGNQADEYAAFEKAKSLNFEAAHDSISMGAAQIMGFNAERVGYANAVDMYKAFKASEAAQFAGMFEFVRTSNGLLKAARTRDWATFAKLYNGAGYAANAYDVKLANAYGAWQKVTAGLPGA